MKSQHGFSLIETLVATALLGLIGVAFLTGLTMSAKSNILMDEQTTAESLAKRQIESIQNETYDPEANYTTIDTSSTPGYSITFTAESFNPVGGTTTGDPGIQKITIIIQRNSRTLFTLEDYKVRK